jgi:ATP-binding cassette subfamily B protein
MLGLLTVQGGLTLWLPTLNADVIDEGVVPGDVRQIFFLGSAMVGVTLLLGACSVATVYVSTVLALRVGRELRTALFRQVCTYSPGEAARFTVASLITRVTSDVQHIEGILGHLLTSAPLAPVTMVIGVVLALRASPALASLLLLVVPLTLAVTGMLVRCVSPVLQEQRLRVDEVSRLSREQLAGVRVIRAFVRTAAARQHFRAANGELARTGIRLHTMLATLTPMLTILFNLASVAMVWIGGTLVDRGELRIGHLIACITYVMEALGAVATAASLLLIVPQAQVSATRIREVLDTTGSLGVVGPAGPTRAAESASRARTSRVSAMPTPQSRASAGTVEFRGISFYYPGAAEPALHDVQLRLAAGTTTAVVGSIGSGKSTLVGLLLRLHEATHGEILLDGVDLRSLAREQVWASLAVVPQSTVLFQGSVDSNVRFGHTCAQPVDVWRALEVAQAVDFVAESPDRLHLAVTRSGTNLSGGQRQRLAVARALVRPARVYVFDDIFSALDQKTCLQLQAALEKHLEGATVLHVTPRLSVARRAQQVVVVDAGTVIATGSHDELVVSCAAYRQLLASQLEEAGLG